MSFQSLGLVSELVHSCTAMGWSQATEVQRAVIPAALAGEDLLVSAQTGTGKSASFLLPLLQRLHGKACAAGLPRALVLVPTRELAQQVVSMAQELAATLTPTPAIQLLIGGVELEPQLAELALGCPLLVATPGRLLELVKRDALSLAQVAYLVLDEADRLLEMGFLKEVQQILALLPARRQSLLFSATFAPALLELATGLLYQPRRIEIAPQNRVAVTIREQGYRVNKSSKVALLLHLLKSQAWPAALVFVPRRDDADGLLKRLQKAGFSAAALHGDKSQQERGAVLAQFRAGALQLLVATDLAARGLDIRELPLVINFALPDASSAYVHRIGRTGRAGLPGLAISLICNGDLPALAAIETLTGRALPLEELAEFPVTDLPAQEETERKRPPRDKQANRRTAQKRSIKQFVRKTP